MFELRRAHRMDLMLPNFRIVMKQLLLHEITPDQEMISMHSHPTFGQVVPRIDERGSGNTQGPRSQHCGNCGAGALMSTEDNIRTLALQQLFEKPHMISFRGSGFMLPIQPGYAFRISHE